MSRPEIAAKGQSKALPDTLAIHISAGSIATRRADSERFGKANLREVAYAIAIAVAATRAGEKVRRAVAVVVDAVTTLTEIAEGRTVKVGTIRATVEVIVESIRTHVGTNLLLLDGSAIGISRARGILAIHAPIAAIVDAVVASLALRHAAEGRIFTKRVFAVNAPIAVVIETVSTTLEGETALHRSNAVRVAAVCERVAIVVPAIPTNLGPFNLAAS